MNVPKLSSGLLLAFALGVAPLAIAKTHDVTATVVAADVLKSTLTLRGDDGKESTAPVDASAAKELASVKAGDKVTVTCRDDDKGNHLAVTAIKAAGGK